MNRVQRWVLHNFFRLFCTSRTCTPKSVGIPLLFKCWVKEHLPITNTAGVASPSVSLVMHHFTFRPARSKRKNRWITTINRSYERHHLLIRFLLPVEIHRIIARKSILRLIRCPAIGSAWMNVQRYFPINPNILSLSHDFHWRYSTPLKS